MCKRRLAETAASNGSIGDPPCTYSGHLGGLDLPPAVCRWLNSLVRHYDSLEWSITAGGLQRTNSFPVTAFHGRPLPISMDRFLPRFAALTKACDGVILVAAVYISRILEKVGGLPVSSCTVHRLVLVAMTVAAKFVQDNPMSNKVVAAIAGIPLKELNHLEVKFLCGIQYDLGVSPADLNTALEALGRFEASMMGVEASVEGGVTVEAATETVDIASVSGSADDASVNTVEGSIAEVAAEEVDGIVAGETNEPQSKRRKLTVDDVSVCNNSVLTPKSGGADSKWSEMSAGDNEEYLEASCDATCATESLIQDLKQSNNSTGMAVDAAPTTAKLSTPERRGSYALVAIAAE